MSLTIVDAALRGGMHSVGHQFTPEQVAALAGALNRAGIDVIEVGHGDGLGGSSVQYGTAAAADEAYVEAAVAAVTTAQVAVLLLPGIGRISSLRRAYAKGARIVHVATHCSEADLAQEHLPWAAEHDMLPVGFLMMSHMLEPGPLREQARLMESYETGIDLFALMDAAEDIAAPLLPREPVIDRLALSLGYAGVYSSFLLHAQRAALKYDVDARDVLLELGRRKMVGGQEDMIIDVAAELAMLP